ncbi:acyl-CoA thioesterase [Chelatococcus reniformis]|uniref:Thioesterase n=1 Tax=Chelatococcus reniformis TaxID=1494448 RepID=A0A916X6T5_9HYPH|nr:thioesterase family protein [Chelatococcus reniformis]GGC46539.1 thioesterase [Chelatococcus reniformis]
MSERQTRLTRADFRLFRPIQTRWLDNDAYGHVNNSVYYHYFDTAVNAYLIENGLLSVTGSGPIGLVVETACVFFESVAYPEHLEAGLRITQLGSSSVRYSLGIFRLGDDKVAAQGRFVHVYVDRESRRPVPIPEAARAVLAHLI